MVVKRWIKIILVILSLVFLVSLTAGAQEVTVRGIVFEDTNRNLQLDLGEKGVEGVCVSNGREVVQTDKEGHYLLPAYQEMVVFVTKPSGYDLPVNEQNVPQFYYIHRPEGSPPNISEYPGIEATGDLPDSVNFPLFAGRESDNFKVVVLGDTQVTNHREISYLRDEIIEEIKGTDALFAISLGDNVNDTLNLYPRYLDTMKEMGIPVFYVPGNHDSNYDSLDEEHQYETYTRYLSAPYYSFNYGKLHFVVLDDVMWDGREYHGELGEKQLTWLSNDLSFVPSDYLVILNMHIPLISYINRNAEAHQIKDQEQLFEILEEREVLALAGHTHTIERFLPGCQGRP